MTTKTPVWFSATFDERTDHHAMLHLSANNDPSLEISVVHQSIVGLATYDLDECSQVRYDFTDYDLAGNETLRNLRVQDGEAIIILVRDHSEIVATGVFQVKLGFIGKLDAMLDDVSSSHLLVDHCSQDIIDRAVKRALDAVCGVTTGELAVAEVH